VIYLKKYTGFFAMWLVNILLICAANKYWPNNFVLGSLTMSRTGGIVFAALAWTVLIWFTQPVLKKLKLNLDKGMAMMIAYLLANFVSLWLVTRLGPAIGFGVSGIMWVFALAFVANFIQYLVWVLLTKLKLAEM